MVFLAPKTMFYLSLKCTTDLDFLWTGSHKGRSTSQQQRREWLLDWEWLLVAFVFSAGPRTPPRRTPTRTTPRRAPTKPPHLVLSTTKRGAKRVPRIKTRLHADKTRQVKDKSENEMLFLQALTPPQTAAVPNQKHKPSSTTSSILSSSTSPGEGSSPSSSSPSRSGSKPGALIYKQSKSLRHRSVECTGWFFLLPPLGWI